MSNRASSGTRIEGVGSNESLDEFARCLDEAALAPGDGEAALSSLGFPLDLARSLLRSRRLRVLDWLAQSGYSTANVFPEATAHFLDVAIEHGLRDAYRTVDRLHASLEPVVLSRDSQGWLCEVSLFETLLICARRVRGGGARPFLDDALVRLTSDARCARVDPRARQAHELLPTHDVPPDVHAHTIDRVLAGLVGELLAPVPMLAVGGIDDQDGIVAELSDPVASLVERLSNTSIPYGDVRDQLDEETFETFLAYELLEPEDDDGR